MADAITTTQDILDVWGRLPQEVQDQITLALRFAWVFPANRLGALQSWIWGKLRAGMPMSAAIRQVGPQFGLKPRTAKAPKDVARAATRVRQYHERQRSRGWVPGRDPRMRRRRESEAWGEALFAPTSESMAVRAGIRPIVARVCRDAKALAAALRSARQATGPSMRRGLQIEANRFVKRWGYDLLSGRHDLTLDEIDYLVGSLAALEHAVGGGVPSMETVRRRAAQMQQRIRAGATP
jgi:hypothetical protein